MGVLNRLRQTTTRAWRIGALLAATVAGGLAACSLLVPLNEQQCTVSADCAARGGPFAGAECVDNVCVGPIGASDGSADGGEDAGAWACLSQPRQVTTSAPVAITFKAFDVIEPITTTGPMGGDDFTVVSYTPVPGMSVEGCSQLDPTCAQPITPLAVSDDAGEVTFVVPQNTLGFFTFSQDSYVPVKLYPGNLLADASTFAPPVAMLPATDIGLLAQAIGVPIELGAEAGVGHAFLQVYDCFDRHAAGVSFTFLGDAGPNTVQWYSSGGTELPNPMATETDDIGAGGAVNVPVGIVSIVATLVTSKTTLGQVDFVVTSGGASFAWLRVRTR
jgi:hypothetical protein